ncbi:MAG: hypothetical protein MN733_08690 [Nitrososphaera sp.]|nr:hypothetical protein [Nitrososphaera sp.]
MSKWIKKLALVGVFWVFLCAFLALQFWPNVPRSKDHWVLLVAFGPPFYLLGESFFGWLFSRKHGQALSDSKFSLTRIVFALVIMLVFLSFTWWLTTFIG